MFMIQNEVCGVVLSKIQNDLVLSFNRVIMSEKDTLLLKWMIESHYISETKLSAAVHLGLCNLGRKCYLWCQNGSSFRINYPDHSLSPEAFGYAIRQGAITPEEAATIRFDHNETLEGFIAGGDGLLESVMEQLAEGVLPFKTADSTDSDSCFCHD